MRAVALTCACAVLPTCAWVALPRACTPPPAATRLASARIVAALDYKDPVVEAEFASVQQLSFDEVEDELAVSGIPASPTMNDIEVRMMLVEVRLRKAGKLGGATASKAAAKPDASASEFEKALYEKPAFKELVEEFKLTQNTNALNLCSEYVNDRKMAKTRYAGTDFYDKVVEQIEAALNAKVEIKVTSGNLLFSGFPASMNEAAIRMTFEAFGSIVNLSVEESDDGMSCGGRVSFEEADSAKALVDKYGGVDMGMGTTLEFQPL